MILENIQDFFVFSLCWVIILWVIKMYCRRCGNDNEELFRTIKKGTYCLKCQGFGRFYIDKEFEQKYFPKIVEDSDYELNYELTSGQVEAAKAIIKGIEEKKNILLYAVCGAGKTEMTMPLISYCLQHMLKVGIAIPRKDVVIELEERYRHAFPKIHVVSVYGGNHECLDGDLIILTTHQLYRYEKVFDVLIVDEVDAFPYANNELLESFVSFATKGNNLFMSATPSSKQKELIEQGKLKLVTLFQRPHGGKLCVPKNHVTLPSLFPLYIYQYIHKYKDKVILLFVPTIQLANQYYYVLKHFVSCVKVTSKTNNREEFNKKVKEHLWNVVVCTTVLERGITIADVQVLVVYANHPVFSTSSLVQISGRVGRKAYAKEGNCLFLSSAKAQNVDEAINLIKEANK